MSGAAIQARRERSVAWPAARWTLYHLALLLVIGVFGAPFLWVLAAAFDRDPGGALPWPREATLANLRALFRDYDFATPLRTSLIIASATMALAVVAVTLAGYALSRAHLRGKETLALGVLLLQTVPLSVTIVPIYDLMRRLDLRDTYLGLILAHAVLGLPFLIWLMKDFFDAIPRAVEEAAWVDGASEARALFAVLLPAARGGAAVVAGYAFLNAWSEVLLALVLVDDARLATVALTFFQSSGSDWAIVAAMALLYLLPVLLVFALVGRLIVGGLITSATGPA